MSHPNAYPEPRYRGDTGVVSAALRRADHDPELSHASGGGAHHLATGASTGGEFGLYRWDMGPIPSGPDAHFHASISESFFVLSGTVRLYDGESWVDGSPGDFLSSSGTTPSGPDVRRDQPSPQDHSLRSAATRRAFRDSSQRMIFVVGRSGGTDTFWTGS